MPRDTLDAMSRVLASICTLLFLLFLGACGSDDDALIVDLRTDYAPGLEFGLVEVTATPSGAAPLELSRTVLSSDSAFPDSLRVAEFRGIPAALTAVDVRLSSRSGEVWIM